MPPSVTAAALLQLAVALLNAAQSLQTGQRLLDVLPGLAIPGLLIFGYLKAHRLAWQWGRIAGVVGAALSVALAGWTAFHGTASPGDLARLFLTVGLPLAAVAVLLSRSSARAWFRLTCPSCRSTHVRPADFLFTKARCRACATLF
jgi:hypothetical protein